MAYMAIVKRRNEERKEVALKEIFNRADTNKNGKISVADFISILEANDIEVEDDELTKIGELADASGEITLTRFIQHLKSSEHWKHELATRIHPGSYISKMEMENMKRDKAEVAFDIYDRNNDDYITREEFAEHSKKLNNDQVRAIFAKFDNDKDGKLTMKEFRRLLDKHKGGLGGNSGRDKAVDAFKLFDKNRDGYITRDEFAKVSKKLNEQQVNAVFSKFDTNNDDKLSLEEFRRLINKT